MNRKNFKQPAKAQPPVDRITYSVRELAGMLGMGSGSVYRAIRTGEIPSIRIGGRILVLKKPFDAKFQELAVH